MLKYPNITITPTYNEVLFKVLYEIALANGSDFFDTVVESISKNLDVKFVLIGEFIKERFTVKSKSLWAGEDIVKDYEYNIANTPCEHVLKNSVKIYPSNLQALFPEDTDLVDWQVHSYIGIPLLNSKGEVIGHIAVLDTKPFEDVELIKTVYQRRVSS